jgi:hypothetical protein
MTGGKKQGAGKMSWHKCGPLLVNSTIVLLSSRTCPVPMYHPMSAFLVVASFCCLMSNSFCLEKVGRLLPALSLLSPAMKSHSEWMSLMNESVEH